MFSRLRIANAQLLDSGNYTCMPTTAEAASVVVNVINGKSGPDSTRCISDIATLSVCFPVLFGSGMMWCVLHRREPRGDAEEQRHPDEWQQAEQSTGPPPGHGGQFRRAMAYWWPPHRHRHQQQLPGFLLEFIHSAYQL